MKLQRMGGEIWRGILLRVLGLISLLGMTIKEEGRFGRGYFQEF